MAVQVIQRESDARAAAQARRAAADRAADTLPVQQLGIDAWDFEVGNDRWNAATQQWEAVGFQPPFDEAHAEAQEYAGGLTELVRIAREQALR